MNGALIFIAFFGGLCGLELLRREYCSSRKARATYIKDLDKTFNTMKNDFNDSYVRLKTLREARKLTDGNNGNALLDKEIRQERSRVMSAEYYIKDFGRKHDFTIPDFTIYPHGATDTRFKENA